MYDVTPANVETLLDRGELYAGMRNGAWWKLRRNGATKRWVRDASRVRIPVKAGLRATTQITETDFYDGHLRYECFRHVSDVPAKYQR